MFWFAVAACAALFVYFFWVKPFNYWSEKGVPQFKFWITWREILLGFAQYRSTAEAVQMIYEAFPASRYTGIYQFFRPILSVRDPELIKEITVKDFDHFVDHFQIFPEESDPLWSKNLFALKGEQWRDMRATLSPSFTSSKMKVMFDLMSDCGKQFVRYFEEQKEETVVVEMKDTFTRFTNDVIASSAFGITCDSLKNRDNDFYVMGKRVTNFGGFWKGFLFLLILMFPWLSKITGAQIFDRKASAFFSKLVKDSIRIREREGIIRPDMIHLLMEARKGREKNEQLTEDVPSEGFAVVEESRVGKEEKRRKPPLTDDDIVAQALIFFFAGFESVSTLMCFMAYELALNPDIHQRLQNEVDDTFDRGGGSVTYEALSKMKYMDMVISETLRKWPGAVALDRVCVKPYTIQPVRDGEKLIELKKGDVVWLPVFGLHRDPQVYPEPERFDPERFSDENKSNVAPYGFIPFGVGPRSCIGNRFALMETKLVFFHLLSKFDITVVEKTPIPLKLVRGVFHLNAEGGFWLGLKSRTKLA